MNRDTLLRKVAGLESWYDNFGSGMEQRAKDGVSWYDLSINCNSIPCETDTAIIVTSWFGQLKWLKATLASYRKTNAFVILAYDNPFYAWAPAAGSEMFRCLPNQQHFLLANSVVFKHITYDCNKRNGWFWDVYYAKGILNGFKNIKHVYITNGDCIIENPSGFKDVIELLGNGDLMAGQQNGDVLHTADVIFKIDAFNKIFDFMFEKMKTPIIGSHSPEVMLEEAVRELKLKVTQASEQPLDKDGTVDMYARYNPPSTFKKLMGFRNLFAELETSWNEGTEPLPAEYVDNFMDWIYFGGEERETLCKYYETGDRRYLYMWWDRGEDSDYNRLYYPIENYGLEPIYA